MKPTFRCAPVLLIAVALAAPGLRAAPLESLFQLIDIKGQCQIRTPGSGTFEAARPNKAYPFGTTVATGRDGAVTVMLSRDDRVRLDADTRVMPSLSPTGGVGRVILFEQGHLATTMSEEHPADAIVIDTPVGQCRGMTGGGDLTITADPQVFTLTAVASSGGYLTLAGPQFVIAQLKAGYSVRVTTTRDRSQTRIDNTLGDYVVLVDKGDDQPAVPIETNTGAAIRIWREAAPVGGRLIVSVFATGSDGRGKERFAFAVGQPLVHVETPVREWTPEEDATTKGEGAAGPTDANGAASGATPPAETSPF